MGKQERRAYLEAMRLFVLVAQAPLPAGVMAIAVEGACATSKHEAVRAILRSGS